MRRIFEHGAASFDPTSTSVILWTRLTGETSADWVLSTDSNFETAVFSGTAQTGPDRDFTVVVDVTGLEPATGYWYRFESSSERSPVGRTSTLPAGPVSSFNIGMVSCARYSIAPLTVYRALAHAEVDLVLHLGDYIYDDEGEKGPRSHDPPWQVKTLSDYRLRLAQIRRDEDCQTLHLRHPMVVIWDDHDFADNAWLGGAKKHDPETDGPWSARRDASVQAHQEWLPFRTPDPSEQLMSYRSLAIGDLAELILLDSRIVGRDSQASNPGAKPVDDPTRSLLGDRQRKWLEERLADTSRPWAVVANGVVVNPIPLSLPFAKLSLPLLPEGYSVVGDRILRDDQWDGYPSEREKLIGFLADRAKSGARSVLLSGDVHSSWAFEGPRGPDGTAVAVEVTVPSVSSAPMGRTRWPVLWRLLDAFARRLEHVRWADVVSRGFTVLQIAQHEVRVGWWFVDPYDVTPVPRTDIGAAFRTLRTAWPPRWEESMPPEFPEDRRGLPGPPLPRPGDVRYVRRWHMRRRLGVLASLSAVAGAFPIAVARLIKRRAGN